MNSKKKLPSPSVTESVATGGIGLWYTGCYINEEDACLLDKMNNNNQESLFQTGAFPDSKAITIKNITVRQSSTQLSSPSPSPNPLSQQTKSKKSKNQKNQFFGLGLTQ